MDMKDLLFDLHSIKEEDLENYIIEHEAYHLVPCSLLYHRPSSFENRAYPEHKIGELHCMKTQQSKQSDIEKLWKGRIAIIDDHRKV